MDTRAKNTAHPRPLDNVSKLSRRRVLSGIAASAIVVGFDRIARAWLTEDAIPGCATASFEKAPPLDGTLLTDAKSRAADATDQGNIIHHNPSAVLRPGSVADIQKMVGFCRANGIKVATRGQHHTTFGQGLTCGLIIENSALDTIHAIGSSSADVDAGVLWHDLIVQAYNARQNTPPVITGYTGLSIAGTLSVGGISPALAHGSQVAHVQALEVVTGAGDVVDCSPSSNVDLFNAMLGGLGQCGIITRATVDLVPVKSMARTYNIAYADNTTFFSDFRILINRGELDRVFNLWYPQGTSGWVYQLNATIYFDPASPPDNNFLMRGLSVPPQAVVAMDSTYLSYVLTVDTAIQAYQAGLMYDRLIKPWFDVFLDDASVEQYVGDVIPKLTPLDVGPTGFLLLFPLKRSLFTQPLFRVPAVSPDSDWIYLFDILTSSVAPGPNPGFVDEMLERNRRLFEKARALGGTRYPIGAIKFSQSDWVQHYGEVWNQFLAAKQKFDPDNILTPGPGIF